MSAAYDALKLLRVLCQRRKLRLDVIDFADGDVGVTVMDASTQLITVASGAPLPAYKRVHGAVLAKFPQINPKGGPHSTRETRAAGRARLLAEQQRARAVRP